MLICRKVEGVYGQRNVGNPCSSYATGMLTARTSQ